MKNLFFLFLLITSYSFSQTTIEGTMQPAYKSKWVVLYKMNGAAQKYVANTQSKTIEGSKNSSFSFSLKNFDKGIYRAVYNNRENKYVEFIVNEPKVTFTFNPELPEESLVFTTSEENKVYQNYLIENSLGQRKLDSIQMLVLRSSNASEKQAYTKSFKDLEKIQKAYELKANGKLAQAFIKATYRKNPAQATTSMQDYISTIIDSFFANMDFTNETLKDSPFLFNRIYDYIFYLNYTDDKSLQKDLFKESIKDVLSKTDEENFKHDIVAFLIKQFQGQKNADMVDYLFAEYYDSFPKNLKKPGFKAEVLSVLSAEVGRIAPDFSWTENNTKKTLHKLPKDQQYVLVFWSTSCPHCTNEIPKLHQYLTQKKNTKVIAFSLEKDNVVWKEFIKNLPNWHHVLGLNKWENKVARTYQIFSTPTYFVLDGNKKIIAKPEHFKDVKAFLEK